MKHLKHCETLLNTLHSMWLYRCSFRRRLRSMQRPRRRVFGNCCVGVSPQMCNRVTNHRDMGIFSRPGILGDKFTPCQLGWPLLIFFKVANWFPFVKLSMFRTHVLHFHVVHISVQTLSTMFACVFIVV